MLTSAENLSLQVSHVLTERDILTATRSEWLVRLLYAFQDKEHVFLAMVSGYSKACMHLHIPYPRLVHPAP